MGTSQERAPLLGGSEREERVLYNDDQVGITVRDNKSKEVKKSATFRELFRFATCLDWILMLFGSLAAMTQGGGWPLLSVVFGDMTNSFINANLTANTSTNGSIPDPGEHFEEVMTGYALQYIYIGTGVMVAAFLQVAFWSMAGERQTNAMRKAFFGAILRQDIGWFDEHQSGELTTRLADDLERVREGLGDKFSFCIQFLAQFIIGFTIGFIKGWKLTLVMMSLSPLLAICASFLGKAVSSFAQKEQTKYAEAGSIAEEVLSCIRTVISFNGQKQEIKRYGAALLDGRKLGIKKATVTGFGLGMTMLLLFCAYGLAFWFGSTEVDKFKTSTGEDGINPGTVFTVFFCVMIGSFSLGNAAPHATAVATAKGAASIIQEILKRRPTIDSSSNDGKRPRDVTGRIKLSNVHFSYPTREEVKVLENFSLTVEAGQTVGLVGPSGCGKSTIVNLIQRFYDPSGGEIYIDNDEIKDLNVRWLRQKIGVVSQEPVLFGTTIEENILLGNPDASMEDIIASAKAANAHDFITALPKGYNTLVGERGAQLSGGQKQRVAIARALVSDPKILLLDEATSALDSESEKVVQAALDKAREGRTTIVVAHRLSTLQSADCIYVMDEGKIVEEGRHLDLMERRGVYFQLVTLQTISDEKEASGGHFEKLIDVENLSDSELLDIKFRLGKSPSKSPVDKMLTQKPSQKCMRQSSVVKPDKEEEPVTKPGFFRMLRENSKEWPFILCGCFSAAVNGCTMPLFAILFSEMIRVFGEDGQKLLDDGLFWSLMFVALGGLNFITNFFQTFLFGQSGERLTYRLRLKVFRQILRQDVAYFDDSKHSTGALTTRLATDASMIKNATGIRLATMLQSVVGLVAGIAIAFYFGWKLALAILGAVPILVLSGAGQMRAMSGSQKRDSQLLEDAGKMASEAIENVRTVQSLTRERHFYDKYSKLLKKPHRENLIQSNVYALAFSFSQGIIFMIYGGAFRFGAYLVRTHEMVPDEVYRVFSAIAFTGIAIGQASSFLPDYSKARLSAGLIFHILDIIPFIDVYSSRGLHLKDSTGEMVLKDVHFSYPTRPDVSVLKGMSLHVKPGQTAALVGVSGCGKSTVVSLLQRYYDPIRGEIKIDGTNIKDYNLVALRSIISVVSQEPILFDCSIADNIAYGVDNIVPMDAIVDAARRSNIHDFIVNLPLGYDTVVGEKGTQLSGGQKQRVAIARALVRDPKILLLDEATSALDTESEKVVQTALDKAREGRTCLVIAHRLSTIQNADVIFVIDSGVIIESGTHQELLNRNRAYYALVKGQQFAKS